MFRRLATTCFNWKSMPIKPVIMLRATNISACNDIIAPAVILNNKTYTNYKPNYKPKRVTVPTSLIETFVVGLEWKEILATMVPLSLNYKPPGCA